MKKKLVSLLLVLGMAFSLLPGTALAAGRVTAGLKQSPFSFAEGSGTKADPYIISTPDQLNAIRQGLDKHYKLANDIDLSAWGDWMPIGAEAQDRYGDPVPFTGSFDGVGHAVSGMTITGSVTDYRSGEIAEQQSPTSFGLFACVRGREETIAPGDAYADADLNGVHDLGIVNCKIDLDTDQILGVSYVGAIAGEAENTRIVNCWSFGGTVRTTTDCYTGGLVGRADHSSIRECWNDASVSTAADGAGHQAGGIAGRGLSCWLSHCFNAGAVSGDNVCGILFCGTTSKKEGEAGKSAIRYCYNSGTLSGGLTVGVGYADTMDNIYNAGTLNGKETSAIYSTAGGAAGVAKVSHSGERFLTDENWTVSPTLNRKVLTALREDQLTAANANAVKGVGGFTDVQAADYFAEPVKWAVGKKITTGTSNTTFSPGNICTKAEALTFLYRAEGEPSYDPPSDQAIRETFDATNDGWFFAYYYEASCWAYRNSMIVPTTYLHDHCTRADFVTYLWKAAGSPKVKAASQFADVPGNAAYAQAVAWAVAQGITTGTSDSAFSPHMTCTRGQIVTFLYRAYRNK